MKFDQSVATAIFGALDICTLIYLTFFISNNGESKISTWSLSIPIIYGIWCSFSFFWSVSDTPLFDVALLVRDFIRCLVAYLMVRKLGSEASWNGILKASSISAILYALVSMSTMDFINENEGVGRYSYESYKDSVGVSRQAAILCILAAGAYLSKSMPRGYSSVGFIGCLFVCLIAFSKMALISLGMALLIAYSIYKTSSVVRLKASIIYIILLTIVVVFKIDYILDYIYSPTGLELMSGRSIFWDGLLEFIWQQPVLGYGLNPVFSLLDQYMVNPPGTAHNEFIQQFVSYGVIGLSLCFFMNILFLRIAFAARNIVLSRVMISLFVFFFFFGLTESVLVLSVFPIYYASKGIFVKFLFLALLSLISLIFLYHKELLVMHLI